MPSAHLAITLSLLAAMLPIARADAVSYTGTPVSPDDSTSQICENKGKIRDTASILIKPRSVSKEPRCFVPKIRRTSGCSKE
jgi:hypothetical protein